MPSPDVQPEPPRKRTLFVFSQHQIVALLATAVDYAVMFLVAWLLHLAPATKAFIGTIIGSICGAFVSFSLGRRWVFQSVSEDIRGQALRYAVVSGLSMALNAGGTALLVRVGIALAVARTLISAVVGMAWNFPMHRYFVFRAHRRQAAAASCATEDRRSNRSLGDVPEQTAPHQTS